MAPVAIAILLGGFLLGLGVEHAAHDSLCEPAVKAPEVCYNYAEYLDYSEPSKCLGAITIDRGAGVTPIVTCTCPGAR